MASWLDCAYSVMIEHMFFILPIAIVRVEPKRESPVAMHLMLSGALILM